MADLCISPDVEMFLFIFLTSPWWTVKGTSLTNTGVKTVSLPNDVSKTLLAEYDFFT